MFYILKLKSRQIYWYMYHLGIDGLDVLLMVSIIKDQTILKDTTSLGSFFLLSYSDFRLEVSVT